MSRGPFQAAVSHLRRLAAPAPVGPSADGELLARFAVRRDAEAFAEIVQRHGPLVWALCRSGLPAADADDAFQATFLVLARQAPGIRKPSSLACWLSGVARRVIRRARSQAARRRMAALPPDLRAADDAATQRERHEWREVLD